MTITTLSAGPRARRLRQLDPKNAATGYLLRYCRGLNRREALENCTQFLMSEQAMPEAKAELAAIHASAELESLNQVAWLDLESSTEYVVVLRTVGGLPISFTVGDLLAAREQARDRGALRVVRSRPLQ
ncbi:MAG: hypothetical protein CMN25_08395 [Salinicola sp.]|uniref:hypothetical protein n=1 Tax=uncultured Salinicola sp. TaxID=1193542 RepID=UPI000C8FED97|nr:hypothetical protein [uncultured Salinicola sp.]MAM57338.1 hypothetical protein [Salinicola sp.]|tara:strand:- start:6 stop:392 length:387 start_codon:yes stop_codon:yes gene_type:complete